MQTSSLLRFDNGNVARVIQVSPYADPADALRMLELKEAKPAIFLSGGASAMSEEAMDKTRDIIEQGIAKFAAENGITVIDGGTNVGIMKMMGQARAKHKYRFPLIGCAPAGNIVLPGSPQPENPDLAPLEPNHSHFVLVDSDHWGAESDMIVGMARALTQNALHACGILINGGKIAQYDVYIASARGKRAMPVIVVDGSGRSANMIASASKTGNFTTAMIKAIVEGGKIDVVTLKAGPQAYYDKLAQFFHV